MVKIAVSAGHGLYTPGKRTPDGEREWTFNNLQCLGFKEELAKYDGVELRLVSDPTGNRDVPLRERTDIANAWGADVYQSFHHNALNGRWGDHTGTETYIYNGNVSDSTRKIASKSHEAIVKVYGLRDRGIKRANFHELRETRMPANLTEGGYMDSRIDIKVMRDDAKVKESGRQVARNLAQHFGLKLKNKQPLKEVSGTIHRVQVGAFKDVANAVKFAEEVEKKAKVSTYIVDATDFIRVQVGAFTVKSNADNQLNKMRSAGYKDAFITTKATEAIPETEPQNDTTTVQVSSKWRKKNGKWTGQVLKQWDSGQQVLELQRMLAKHHFYPEKAAKNNGVDGFYGAKTKDAVKRFQSMNGLTVDGIAGPATYRKAK